MCGLVCLVAGRGEAANPSIVERMLAPIFHRGPNDEGLAFDREFGAGFRRLSILDLTPAGHQPMRSQDGRYTLVFNGEIYNFIELRRELMALGHRFESTGDAEVLLKSFAQWGSQCVERLNGMWAFLVFDHVTRTLFGSRDRFGIKPLYRYRHGQSHLFASEIKSILASGLHSGRVDMATCAGHLLEHRLDESPDTFFEGIEQLPPAHNFELSRDGRYRQWCYWTLDHETRDSGADAPERFADLFEDVIGLQMRSDVPVGVSLSGGLDSTSIICAAARLRERDNAHGPLAAFSFMTPEFDESRYIEATLAQTGATMHRLQTTPQGLWNDLRRMLWFQDEPVHTITAAVGYQLMELAASHDVKVLLNGQGADETLAGYPSYFRDLWHTLLGRGDFAGAVDQVKRFAAAQGVPAMPLLTTSLRRLIKSYLWRIGAYRTRAHQRARVKALDNRWYRPDLKAALAVGSITPAIGLKPALADATARQPLPLFLRIEDRNSMAHSIEARVPFLDHRLVEFAFAQPEQQLMDAALNKWILRRAMSGRIPEVVRTRPDKMGFPTPISTWARGPLFQQLREAIGSAGTLARSVIDVDVVLDDLERHRRGEVDHGPGLFDVAQFCVWTDGLNSRAVPASRELERPIECA